MTQRDYSKDVLVAPTGNLLIGKFDAPPPSINFFMNEDITDYILHDPKIRGSKDITMDASRLVHRPADVLNVVQRETVTWATQLKGIGLLAGPPGTGKTQTAAELIYELLKQLDKKPLIVVSSSNAAVNELLSRVILCRQRHDPEGIWVIGRLCSKSHGRAFRDSEIGAYDIASKVIRARSKYDQQDQLE